MGQTGKSKQHGVKDFGKLNQIIYTDAEKWCNVKMPKLVVI